MPLIISVMNMDSVIPVIASCDDPPLSNRESLLTAEERASVRKASLAESISVNRLGQVLGLVTAIAAKAFLRGVR